MASIVEDLVKIVHVKRQDTGGENSSQALLPQVSAQETATPTSASSKAGAPRPTGAWATAGVVAVGAMGMMV
ncbi:hypothetical protein MMC20_000183 [Loxospora ochrophaea]|nr:hypothetical protein [Loxospora ochrophaea]